MTRQLTIGECCAGYGGLSMAVEEVFNARPAWFAEYEAFPSAILAHHWPAVPNHGDMTAINWAAVEPVDIISGGSPCQDLSHAGRRRGMTEGTRSNLWVQMREAIATIRPQYVVWENVRGAYSAAADSDMEPCPGCVGDDPGVSLRALGRVLGDLSDLGYDCAWHGLTAASIGAPHGRFRVFVLAWRTVGNAPGSGLEGAAGEGVQLGEPCGAGGVAENTHGAVGGERGVTAPGEAPRGWARAHPRGRGGTSAADTAGDGRDERWPEPTGVVGGSDVAVGSDAAADSVSGGCDGWAPDEIGHEVRRVATPGGGEDTPTDAEDDGLTHDGSGGLEEELAELTGDSGTVEWGEYGPAIRRWETVLGREAPAPTAPGRAGAHRLSADFVEWLMGVPAGHVTAVPVAGMSPGALRNAQLAALGNGVVPAQAVAALRYLLDVNEGVRAQAVRG